MSKVNWIEKGTKKQLLLFSVISRYFHEVAERYNVDINTLHIHFEYNTLYINSVTGYRGDNVKQLEAANLDKLLDVYGL